MDNNWIDSEIRRKEEQLSIWQERQSLSVGAHVFKIVLGVIMMIVGIVVMASFTRTWSTSSIIWGYVLLIGGMIILAVGIALTIVKSIQKNRSYGMCSSLQSDIQRLRQQRNAQNSIPTGGNMSTSWGAGSQGTGRVGIDGLSGNLASSSASQQSAPSAAFASQAANNQAQAVVGNDRQTADVRQPTDQEFDALIRFKELLDKGIITQAEFDEKKNAILNGVAYVVQEEPHEPQIQVDTVSVSERLEQALKFSTEKGLRDYIATQAQRAYTDEEKEVFGKLSRLRMYELRSAVEETLAGLKSAEETDKLKISDPEVADDNKTVVITEDINTTETTAETAVATAEPDRVKFCENCGARLEEGVAFCTECGRKIEYNE